MAGMIGEPKYKKGQRVNHRHAFIKRNGEVLSVMYASGYIQYCVAFPGCTAIYVEDELELHESELAKRQAQDGNQE